MNTDGIFDVSLIAGMGEGGMGGLLVSRILDGKVVPVISMSSTVR